MVVTKTEITITKGITEIITMVVIKTGIIIKGITEMVKEITIIQDQTTTIEIIMGQEIQIIQHIKLINLLKMLLQQQLNKKKEEIILLLSSIKRNITMTIVLQTMEKKIK
ncbi:hypothetical protein D3C73_1257970 [compost metagenome]